MRIINLKGIKIKTRVALAYSIFMVLISIGLIFFINISLQRNLQAKPIIYKIAPASYQVTVTQIPKNYVSGIPGEELPQFDQYRVTSNQFNSLFSLEVFKRVGYLSVVAIFGVLAVSFFVSYILSSKLLNPLTVMANMTRGITPDNLKYRLRPSNSDDEVMKLTEAFNSTLDRVQNAYLNLEEFNAYASHELKNALAVLKTRLEVDRSKGDCSQLISYTIEQVNSITRIVNDILAISSRNIQDEFEPVDMALVAAQTVDEYMVAGRKITLELPDEGVQPVGGREIWFQRVISNLVDNAIKHSSADKPINVSVRQYQSAVILKVTDQGEGIDEKDQGSIWNPYYSSSSDNKGYGLGLAMVKHVVDICSGATWVESQPGKGSSFYITLPLLVSG
jgi:signal transduction histidine kinase